LFTETKNTPKKKKIDYNNCTTSSNKKTKNWDFLLICRPTSSSLLSLSLSSLSLSLPHLQTAKVLTRTKETELPSYFLEATYFFFRFSKHLQYGRTS
jgi:hypothetical protein